MTDFDSKARAWDANPEFAERGRQLAAAIGARIALGPGLRVLDVGCGTGQLSLPLAARAGHVTAVDTSAGMLALLEEKLAAQGIANVATARCDLSAGGMPDGPYGLVASSLTLHHVPDVPAMLSAFAALLEPGGWLALADMDLEDGSFHGPGVAVHPGFARTQLAASTRAAGFAEPRFDDFCVIRKERAGVVRDYPVFLMCARRAG